MCGVTPDQFADLVNRPMSLQQRQDLAGDIGDLDKAAGVGPPLIEEARSERVLSGCRQRCCLR
jgi:hypothetical protein